MSQKLFCLIGGIVFLLIAIGHLLRVIFRAPLNLAGFAAPMWASWVAFVVLGYLAFAGLRASRATS